MVFDSENLITMSDYSSDNGMSDEEDDDLVVRQVRGLDKIVDFFWFGRLFKFKLKV